MKMNKPKNKIKAGLITASVWNNIKKSKDGNEFTTVSVELQRAYQDKEGNWQNTSSLRKSDLPLAILVLQKTYEELSLNSPSKDISNGKNECEKVGLALAEPEKTKTEMLQNLLNTGMLLENALAQLGIVVENG